MHDTSSPRIDWMRRCINVSLGIAVLGLIITIATSIPISGGWIPQHEPHATLVRIVIVGVIGGAIVGLLGGMTWAWGYLRASWRRSSLRKLDQERARVRLLSSLLADLRPLLDPLRIESTVRKEDEILLVLTTSAPVALAPGDRVLIMGTYSDSCMGSFEIDSASAGSCTARCLAVWDDGVDWWDYIRACAMVHAPPHTTAAAYLVPRREDNRIGDLLQSLA